MLLPVIATGIGYCTYRKSRQAIVKAAAGAITVCPGMLAVRD